MGVKTVYMTSSGESFDNETDAKAFDRLWYSWERGVRGEVVYAVGPAGSDFSFKENGQDVTFRANNDYRIGILLEELYRLGMMTKGQGDK